MPFPKHMQVPQGWRDHDDKVKPYVWSHRVLGWTKSLIGLGLLVAFFTVGWGRDLESWVEARVGAAFLRWLLYFGVLAVAWELIGLPFDAGHHAIERKFALSKQGWGSWLVDKLKGLGVGAVLGTIALGLLFIAQKVAPDAWWVIACTLLVGFSIVLAQLAPVLLIPLFFKLRPMEEGPLKERLLALCRRFAIEVKDIYHLGMGEKTEKGNAAFTGLGRTKRILIGDTLYERYSADEVEAVFAHELGHQVHNDLWKGIAFSAIGIYLAFFVADLITRLHLLPWAGMTIHQAYGLFLFFIALSIIQMPIGVVQAVYSRSREHAADDFAANKIGLGEWLSAALEKLTYQNYGYFRPNPVMEFLTHSHPAPWRRILFLKRA